MSVANTFAQTFTRTQTAIFVADKMRNLMKALVIDAGLNPTALMDAWSDWLHDAARKLMETGHLTKLIIEFYQPGSNTASGRWDFPIRYDGTDIDDMWVDVDYFRQSFAKAPRPPAGCSYRVLLQHSPGAPSVGLATVQLKSLGSLAAREAGTVIATPDIMASATYYR
ncbi:hypothetical protein ACFYE9_24955 [Rhizobium leguminosarum]|uniref:Bacterial HORMA domain-containing protein n=2 Tax=Rhizobium leguminosarum TaxID=384 RepID=A0A154ITS0_RHILE|nr:hypothetical protein [Rhizobium leguminosarum]API50661.1 hypothetical protein BMW22_02550 [Rhizobium leguminosarum]KZB03440.1 hypothetical protein A4A59_00210 [Rhizobium leguminosarum]MBY5840429.1 hypothetical protein [Rhizobium leguminosarum]NKM80178.1 hypothetical protein [Rhizobium leguminosarum bv. viciae]QSZ06920.1 hypothetical protein J3P71_18865 [Rhizobium leguminosarum]